MPKTSMASISLELGQAKVRHLRVYVPYLNTSLVKQFLWFVSPVMFKSMTWIFFGLVCSLGQRPCSALLGQTPGLHVTQRQSSALPGFRRFVLSPSSISHRRFVPKANDQDEFV